ncbi:MAG: riboflavin biosynthesis protein RibF [Nitrospirae bacterium RBG_13_39_12]|nr:MAG: riboflavin biosynthesis protein RibF [Nitrospirae bacterium RBG_13_39_12]
MEIIRGLEKLNKNYPNTVLTIGNFDGVHLGHRKILLEVIKKARAIHGTSMAITFEPHPMKVLAPERELRILTTFEEKAKLIADTGINVLLCVNFNRKFANLLPDEFIEDVLVKKIRAREIIVGANYSFGKNKQGTVDLLRRRGKKHGFSVKVMRHAKINSDIVSSSKIRSLLSKGNASEVSTFLGRAYSIEGRVIKGKGRGKKLLNIPTANITTPVEIAPKEGVYAVRVGFNNSVLEGVANIGKNPTFGNAEVSYEVHLFNFSRDILGKMIRIYFIDRIRGERQFPDPFSLEKQIRTDIETAREILKKKHPKLI